MGKVRDLKGKEFDKLKVLYRVANKGRRAVWRCKCKCGSLKDVCAYHLVDGQVKSCGCSRYVSGENHCNWKGHGAISGRYWGSMMHKAKERGYDFCITIEEAWALFVKQGSKCALSGRLLCFGDEQTASLDRKDNNRGYYSDNIQWVHKDINWMKQDFDEAYFVGLCIDIAKNARATIAA